MTDHLQAQDPAAASTGLEPDAAAAAATPTATTMMPAPPLAVAVDAPAPSSSAPPASGRRAVCGDCRRPATVCLCPAFPPVPLRLRGACVVLQHPCEAKRKLATVPLLRRAIDARDFSLVRGRRFDAEPSAPALHALLRRAAAGSAPVLVLWPRAGVSVGLGRAMREEGGRGQQQQQRQQQEKQEQEEQEERGAKEAAADDGAPPPPPPLPPPLAYLLIAIDGTWVQAQEMAGPLARWISRANGGPAVLVHLDAEGGEGDDGETEEGGAGRETAGAAAAAAGCIPAVVGDPALRWRTEPVAAGMSTCEAVARALEVCEAHAAEAEARRRRQGGDGATAAAAAATGRPGAEAAKEGAALRAALVAPIARLVALQVKFDPSMRARTGQRPAEDAEDAGTEAGGGAAAGGGAESGQEGGGGGGGGGGAYIRPSSRFRASRREAKALKTGAVVVVEASSNKKGRAEARGGAPV